jgi:hypothetical protein
VGYETWDTPGKISDQFTTALPHPFGCCRKKYKVSAPELVAFEFARDGSTFQMQDFEALCSEVHRRSRQRDLREPVEAGLLEATGATNRLIYLAPGSHQN